MSSIGTQLEELEQLLNKMEENIADIYDEAFKHGITEDKTGLMQIASDAFRQRLIDLRATATLYGETREQLYQQAQVKLAKPSPKT